ncbi:MAG: cryptochrome/photolyase family protein, partial [Pseudomonadota bacterium]
MAGAVRSERAANRAVGKLRFVLGDQLSRSLSSLADLDPETDVVLMAEVSDEATYVRHHKKKIAFILAAMRHFAAALRAEGIQVDYVQLDDPQNSGSFTGELKRAVVRHDPDEIIVTEPGEYRVFEAMNAWASETGRPVTVRDDDRFFASPARFAAWAKGKRQLRMEYFYREMRRETGLLMENNEPVGGQWNFDADNRRRLPDAIEVPDRFAAAPDARTCEVLDLVAEQFPDHFGNLEPFSFAVTRDDALRALDAFIETCLPNFGDYQDAMKRNAPYLFHAVLSPYLNVGLLLPREVC